MGCLAHAKMEPGTYFLSGGLELGDVCPTEGLGLHSSSPCPIPCDLGHTSAHGWTGGKGAIGPGERSLMVHPGSGSPGLGLISTIL